jgi:hypothetical protein
MPVFKRFLRFVDADGHVQGGEVPPGVGELVGLRVATYNSDNPLDSEPKLTGKEAQITSVRSLDVSWVYSCLHDSHHHRCWHPFDRPPSSNAWD